MLSAINTPTTCTVTTTCRTSHRTRKLVSSRHQPFGTVGNHSEVARRRRRIMPPKLKRTRARMYQHLVQVPHPCPDRLPPRDATPMFNLPPAHRSLSQAPPIVTSRHLIQVDIYIRLLVWSVFERLLSQGSCKTHLAWGVRTGQCSEGVLGCLSPSIFCC